MPLPAGIITSLPSHEPVLAWTVDDGSDSEVIRLYIDFARTTGTRLTFFLNGSYPGWTTHAALLRPLVASGTIQLGNHTWSHADLTGLTDRGIVDELQRNHDFIMSTFDVDPRPYYRPPYGYRDRRTDAAAASIGYTSPVMWYGSLADSGPRTEQQIINLATEWTRSSRRWTRSSSPGSRPPDDDDDRPTDATGTTLHPAGGSAPRNRLHRIHGRGGRHGQCIGSR